MTSKLAFGVATGIAALLLATVASAGSAPAKASLLIRHQVRGCHAWSVNGGPFKASQSTVLRRGGSLTITNNDVMAHTLVKTSGPAVAIVSLKTGTMGMGMHMSSMPGAMTHMGASTKVTFSKAGVYRFTTRAGEDYMSGMKTIGPDNILRLRVAVS
jgi:plastocyanin